MNDSMHWKTVSIQQFNSARLEHINWLKEKKLILEKLTHD